MRYKSIDFLRFIAVFLVLLRHFDFQNINNVGSSLYFIFNYFQQIGWIGVDLFFVISGFLVSGLIFDEIDKKNDFNAKQFLIRRGFKIYPSFYFLIFCTSSIFILKNKFVANPFVNEIFYLQNYFKGAWNHTWSLAVEEHFYFFLAILFLIWKKYKFDYKSLKFLYFLLICILLIIFIKRYYMNEISSNNRIIYYTQTRMDALLFGVLISLLSKYQLTFFNYWKKYFALPIIIILIPFVFHISQIEIFDKIQFEFGYTLLFFFFGNIILFCLHYERIFHKKLFILPIKIGVFSYSIYLWHMPCKFWVLSYIEKMYKMNYWEKLFIYFLSAFLIGIFFAKIIELPFLKIRERFFPSNKS